jgi:hypothetical protein
VEASSFGESVAVAVALAHGGALLTQGVFPVVSMLIDLIPDLSDVSAKKRRSMRVRGLSAC